MELFRATVSDISVVERQDFTNVFEDHILSKIWPLATHLEVLPAALNILLRRSGVAQLVLLVVLSEEILDDGAGLVVLALCLECSQPTEIMPTSHRVTPVFGSWIDGRRPFGFTFVYGSFLTSPISTNSVSKGKPSS